MLRPMLTVRISSLLSNASRFSHVARAHRAFGLVAALAWGLVLAVGCRSEEPSFERGGPPQAVEAPGSRQAGAGAPGANDPTSKSQPAAPTEPTGDLLHPPAHDARAPERYAIELETSRGTVLIDVTRSWAPRGADRLYTLVRLGYFKDVAFFRVIEGFMAQWGIHGDPAVNRAWRGKTIADDPVRQKNTRGMVSFATSGPNSRTNQLFVNFGDNSRLDAMGFSPVGQVRDMKSVDALYAGYGEGAPQGRGPEQGRFQMEGNAYLKASFPELDYIRSARILP